MEALFNSGKRSVGFHHALLCHGSVQSSGIRGACRPDLRILVLRRSCGDGLIIFGLALYLSELVARAVRGSGVVQANLLAMVAKISIVVLGSTMALRQMGLANDIVAIGVGGRHIAARELEKWVDSLKSEE